MKQTNEKTIEEIFELAWHNAGDKKVLKKELSNLLQKEREGAYERGVSEKLTDIDRGVVFAFLVQDKHFMRELGIKAAEQYLSQTKGKDKK